MTAPALTAAPPRLVARTVRVPDGPDLLDGPGPDGFAWVHAGWGFVTEGVTARVAADAVDAALATVTVHDDVARPGTGALAVGALPFDPAAPAALVIPAVVHGVDADGTRWRTEIGAVGGSRAAGPTVRPVPSAPGAARVADRTDRAEWAAAVAAALEAVAAGTLEKVVLARTLDVRTEHAIAAGALLRRLADREPGRFLVACASLVGASPELLVQRRGETVRARPLAGSSPAGPGAADRLDTDKNRREHRLVADAVRRTLAGAVADVVAEDAACIRLADVAHLATEIHGRATAATPSALGLARRLHPTPAVGGVPTDAALALIRRIEGDRGRYAGPVGWVDATGDGEFALALRCAELDPADPTHAVVRAGAGIVAGSDADDEWTEIDAKLRPVLAAFGR